MTSKRNGESRVSYAVLLETPYFKLIVILDKENFLEREWGKGVLQATEKASSPMVQ